LQFAEVKEPTVWWQSLLGTVVGGAIVVLGQWLTVAREDRRAKTERRRAALEDRRRRVEGIIEKASEHLNSFIVEGTYNIYFWSDILVWCPEAEAVQREYRENRQLAAGMILNVLKKEIESINKQIAEL
jgi:hypothetical protein